MPTKAQLADFVKGLSAEERTEVGLVSSEDLEALKTQLTETKTELAELGKRAQATAVYAGPAMQTGIKVVDPQDAERHQYESLRKSADPDTARYAREWLEANPVKE